MEKLYYSIAEVAKMFNVNQSLLRFWEKEFKQLSPRRNEKGTRFYTKQDIFIIKQIECLSVHFGQTSTSPKFQNVCQLTPFSAIIFFSPHLKLVFAHLPDILFVL